MSVCVDLYPVLEFVRNTCDAWSWRAWGRDSLYAAQGSLWQGMTIWKRKRPRCPLQDYTS